MPAAVGDLHNWGNKLWQRSVFLLGARVMRKANVLLWLSALLLAVSLLETSFLALASVKAEWTLAVLPAEVIVHLGVLAVVMLALKELWHLRDRSWRAAVREF